VRVIVLDTDVASSLLERRLPEPISRQLVGQVPAVTFVTVGELTKWTLVHRWRPPNVAVLRSASPAGARSASATWLRGLRDAVIRPRSA
jgi:hypothetical protein